MANESNTLAPTQSTAKQETKVLVPSSKYLSEAGWTFNGNVTEFSRNLFVIKKQREIYRRYLPS